MNLASFSRRRYTKGHTPVEHLTHLSALLGGPEIYIKRDDQLGLAGGGNKTRKLEFLIADALAQGADTVITTGAVQSNHCRLTLAAAVKEGLRCCLILEERVPNSYDKDALGNNFLFKLLGAESVEVVPAGTDLASAMSALAERITKQGGTPYVIPGGGSNPLGALGYVSCAQEVESQAFDLGLPFDKIVCSSGSGGTHAGLVAGLHSTAPSTPVIGISVRAKNEDQVPKIHSLANETLALLGEEANIPENKITVLDNYVGPGYSLPTPEMTEAIQMFARTEAILLDPVYTGKTAAGLIGEIRAGNIGRNERVLFVHTGGSPALYAYPEESLRKI